MQWPEVERNFARSNCCEEFNWHYHENCYKIRLCDENKLQKAEEKRTSGNENLIGCDVAETATPNKLLRRSLDSAGRQNSDVKAFVSSMYNIMPEKIRFACHGMTYIVIIWYI
jgi:hypothetical protein